MPFYDYKCRECGEKFEVSHGMNDKPAVKCEHCGSGDTSRVFNSFGRVGGDSGGHSHGGGCSSCGSGSCGSCKH
ncbi:MAG TPA: zinc ribbon domain-containing protein [Candidatus Omnitrophota bacterium]|nr:zinc ribbon domain-containing protein [Candidatus Omnitrophota bacterium]